jgi:septum site-determining protein MinC
MEAELVSIAGNFMLSDALQNIVWKDSAQVLLVDDSLEIVPL